MHALRSTVVALIWTLGCHEAAPVHSAPSTATPTLIPASGSASARPSQDAPTSSAATPAPSQRVHSFAVFEKDELDLCVDSYVDASSPKAKLLADEEGVAQIADKCSESFKGRLVLATCAMTVTAKPADAGPNAPDVKMTLIAHFYRFANVVDSDYHLRECLQAQGKWDALPRDSADFKRAERERRFK
jgi:hypothetical protein